MSRFVSLCLPPLKFSPLKPVSLTALLTKPDFLDFHPGGTQILKDYAGRDATGIFRESHDDWLGLLREYDHLRVGRLIASRPAEALSLAGHEIRLHNTVYSTQPLRTNKGEADFYAALAAYHGTDATATITARRRARDDEGEPISHVGRDALLRLAGMANLAVARAVAPPRSIDTAELARNSWVGQLPRLMRSTWVSLDGDVYDVTPLAAHSRHHLRDRLLVFAGREVSDAEVAAWLKKEHRWRIIARMPGPANLMNALKS